MYYDTLYEDMKKEGELDFIKNKDKLVSVEVDGW